MTSPAAPPAPLPASALAVLFLTVFINLVGFGLVVPLLPFFAQSLDADPWQVTLVFSAYSLGQFFAEPFWGRLSDRIGRKPVLLMTLIANAVGYLALAFAPNIWAAIAIRAFTGLGAGNISTVQGYVADVTPPEQRAGRMGLIGAAFGMGFIVGPGLGGLLTQPQLGRLGFQLPIFTASALAALAALGVILFLRESRAKADPAAPRPAFLSGLRDARSNPVVARVLVVTLLYMGAFAAMESVFGLWAESRYAWTAREVGLSFMIVGIVSSLNQAIFTGRLARRFGESRVLAAGMLLFGAALVIQVVAPVAWFPATQISLGVLTVPILQGWIIPVVMALGACGMSLAMPNISALISRATPPDRQGAMLGLNMASGSIARVIGPILAGALFSGVGHDWPFLVGALLTVPAAIMAINAGRAMRREARAEAPAPAV
ncbi:MFS transporter [Brevundimonas sp.]|jgi:MFS family permease|uniref:MFS transporter n=1 Tax=Brevundimonas sp. TaxID=1871086 RepID=UPI002E0F8417|nr:MFS transporter [Brevundimonas sp.]